MQWSADYNIHIINVIHQNFGSQKLGTGHLGTELEKESIRKSWDALEESAAEDPYRIHPLLVENDRGGGASNMAEWIDFTGSLKELEFTTIRRELRMIIGATYGVLPLYFGELPTGWSQEGLQVTNYKQGSQMGSGLLYKGILAKDCIHA